MKLHALCSSITLLTLASLAGAQSLRNRALLSSTQIVVVNTRDWNAVDGILWRYERARPSKRWKLAGEPIPVVVGRSGLAWGVGVEPTETRAPLDPVKKEGDGRAPAGIFALSTAFGYAAQQPTGWKMPYLNLTPSVECVDDSDSRFYTRILDRGTVSPDWRSSEKMLRSDDAYRWGIVVDHNANPPAPGGGSCIFLHIWYGQGQGTSGCTAMPREQLEALLAWLDPANNPMLVQFPSAEYKKQRKHWHLPKLPESLAARGGS